jgi:FkbH-like protein
MNLALGDALAAAPGVFVLDAARWLRASARPFPPKSWYMGKFAFGNDVFQEAVADVKAALQGVRGQARKMVVVDLDETLWGGIVGEVGWEGLVLGGHDPVGEALADFQGALKALANRGLVLGIVSKNDEATALEAIDRHPEMRLRRDDFAGWRINWQDKARNVAELAEEVNLGLQSVVFLDDNPAERARVREALPEVLVPEWPADKTLYKRALLALRCFDAPALSEEDRGRARMYAQDRRRRETQASVQSLDEWLASLEMKVTAAPLDEGNLARAAQLLNKTNQMNLSTRRMTEKELLAWAGAEGRWLWTFRVEDRFGDLGLTGLVSLAREGATGRVVDFLLSCRVMGRKVEETMLAVAVEKARQEGLDEVVAELVPTAKNKPCREWWEQSAFRRDPLHPLVFRLPKGVGYPVPSHVDLLVPELSQEK